MGDGNPINTPLDRIFSKVKGTFRRKSKQLEVPPSPTAVSAQADSEAAAHAYASAEKLSLAAATTLVPHSPVENEQLRSYRNLSQDATDQNQRSLTKARPSSVVVQGNASDYEKYDFLYMQSSEYLSSSHDVAKMESTKDIRRTLTASPLKSKAMLKSHNNTDMRSSANIQRLDDSKPQLFDDAAEPSASVAKLHLKKERYQKSGGVRPSELNVSKMVPPTEAVNALVRDQVHINRRHTSSGDFTVNAQSRVEVKLRSSHLTQTSGPSSSAIHQPSSTHLFEKPGQSTGHLNVNMILEQRDRSLGRSPSPHNGIPDDVMKTLKDDFLYMSSEEYLRGSSDKMV